MTPTPAEPVEPRHRRADLAAVFGDVLPGTTADEREPGGGDNGDRDDGDRDRWYRDNRPPHHDRD